MVAHSHQRHACAVIAGKLVQLLSIYNVDFMPSAQQELKGTSCRESGGRKKRRVTVGERT